MPRASANTGHFESSIAAAGFSKKEMKSSTKELLRGKEDSGASTGDAGWSTEPILRNNAEPGASEGVEVPNIDILTQNRDNASPNNGDYIRDKQGGHPRGLRLINNINKRKRTMNKQLENKLTMYMGVSSVLGENSSKVAAVPALEESVAKFGNVIGAIERKAKEFDAAATGKTVLKMECEDLLLEDLMPAVFALSAYAHANGETVLAVKSNVSETAIRRLRDTEIIAKATGLVELLEANLDKLAGYGVTIETVKAIRKRIDAFTDALGKKESGYSDRTSLRKSLEELFDEGDFLLTRQIDSMMEQFRKKEAEFYNAYSQARFIKALGAPRKAKAAAALAQPAN